MKTLDAPLRALTGYRLRRTTSAAMSRLNTVFAQFGLRRATYATLAIVVETPGHRQGKVAEALAIERPNFVQIVDELENAGLVLREKQATDRRAYALTPTPKGIALCAEVSKAAQAFEVSLTCGMSDAQISALHEALDVMAANIKCQEETENGQ